MKFGPRSYYSRQPDSKGYIGCALIIFVLMLAVCGSLAYVAYHFITKFW